MPVYVFELSNYIKIEAETEEEAYEELWESLTSGDFLDEEFWEIVGVEEKE